MRGSSGVQRTLQFSRYLANHGWQPDVLTLSPRAHPLTGPEELADIPEGTVVKRALAFDTARHLSIAGRYPGFLAWPDRWSSWLLSGVPTGLALIKQREIDVIWSTYPIATAHVIGLALARLTKLPWIADCRDSMLDDSFPTDPAIRRAHDWIEKRMVAAAARVVFTTNGTRELYRRRYPDAPQSRWAVIENGYDERTFSGLPVSSGPSATSASTAGTHDKRSPLHLVHSGLIYPSERDPREFLKAIGLLKQEQMSLAATLQVTLRATGHDDYIREWVERFDIADVVTLAPGVPYRDALAEMLDADGLLLLQGSSCNHQIPAKAYEYIRAQRPIIGLTDLRGDTARLLLESGIDTVASLDSADEIMTLLKRFMAAGEAPLPTPDQHAVRRHSREHRTAELAALLDGLAD